jgi:hypothetical protein
MQQSTQTTVSDKGNTAENYAPRHMTLRENLILTLKIFVIGAAVLGVLWGAGQWTSAR